MEEFFGEIQVPTETVVEIKDGKHREKLAQPAMSWSRWR